MQTAHRVIDEGDGFTLQRAENAENKDHVVSVRFTTRERRALELLAIKRGLKSVGVLLRDLSLKGLTKPL